MPTLRKKSEYWGRPKSGLVHPYAAFEGTPLWRAVKKALSDLEKNQDIELKEWHQYVVGYVCGSLSKAGVATRRSKTIGKTINSA